MLLGIMWVDKICIDRQTDRIYTVKPPVNVHPKCQALWLFTRGGRLREVPTIVI